MITRIMSGIKYLFNIPTVSKELLYRKSPLVMHVSDTPDYIYRYLFRVIRQLHPDALIHTGDFVDNTKLESRIHLKEDYGNTFGKLIFNMKKHITGNIILVPGNHDNVEIINQQCRDCIVKEEGSIIELFGKSFELSHYAGKLKGKADYCLYGHNSNSIQNSNFYNGYNHINLFLPVEGKVFTMKYPIGIMEMRGIQKPFPRGI